LLSEVGNQLDVLSVAQCGLRAELRLHGLANNGSANVAVTNIRQTGSSPEGTSHFLLLQQTKTKLKK
jgi:hypothetical protein